MAFRKGSFGYRNGHALVVFLSRSESQSNEVSLGDLQYIIRLCGNAQWKAVEHEHHECGFSFMLFLCVAALGQLGL